MTNKIKTVEEYFLQFDGDVRQKLITIRACILSVDPSLEEKMSWNMPTYFKKVNIIHFSANKNHIGIYPAARAIEKFKNKLKEYKTSKGAIQIPYDKPIPSELIKDLVRYNLKIFVQNLKK
ncbi:MAG: DUF1801 domain-containing protein [Bacilli bacterium]|nr:DUF1801 domain-containing protein [Bacilli bacterium]